MLDQQQLLLYVYFLLGGIWYHPTDQAGLPLPYLINIQSTLHIKYDDFVSTIGTLVTTTNMDPCKITLSSPGHIDNMLLVSGCSTNHTLVLLQ